MTAHHTIPLIALLYDYRVCIVKQAAYVRQEASHQNVNSPLLSS